MEVYKGLKINFIEVLSTKTFNIDNKRYYECKCDCGNEKLILQATIRSRRIRDCGCGEFARRRLIGQTFGKLLVVDATRNNKAKKKNIICICKCLNCGKTKKVIASKLTNLEDSSCICQKRINFDKYKNKTFGKITILDLVDSDKKIVSCKCNCGNIFQTKLYNLTSNPQSVISCGKCGLKRLSTDKTRLSGVFFKMIKRCYDKESSDYKWYGNRGIIICDEWLKDKNTFIKWALENGYQKGLTIDRIDSNGNYEPSNCRWVDWKTQQNNRCNNKKFYYNNEYLPLLEIANRIGLNISTLRSRLRSGMSFVEATTTPLMRKRK